LYAPASAARWMIAACDSPGAGAGKSAGKPIRVDPEDVFVIPARRAQLGTEQRRERPVTSG
jgi:hypothetical protein